MLLQQAIATMAVCHYWCFWFFLAMQIDGYLLDTRVAANFNPIDTF